MTNEIVEMVTPAIIMDVISYSNIAQKLNFLAQAIRNEKEAENQNIYIECYETEIDETPVKMIRFSTDLYLWTEIHPYDKENGTVLPESVAVNLYDLYNVVDNCKDDVISFWIDGNELVVSSFFNDVREFNELEVRLKINERGFPFRNLEGKINPEEKEKFCFELDQMSFRCALALNTERRVDGVNVVFKDRHMSIQSNYHGLKTSMVIKQYKEQVFFNDGEVFIPFYVLNLIPGTLGEAELLNPVKFKIYENSMIVETEDYKFAYKLEKRESPFSISDEGSEDYFVVDSKNMEAVSEMLNRINKPAPISVATIEKIDKDGAEILVEYEGRYSAIARIDLAMLSDEKIFIDSDILYSMFAKIGVDAIKAKYNPKTKMLYIKYENYFTEMEMSYDHEEFMDYRTKERLK